MLVLLDDGAGCPVAAKAGPWDRLRVRLSAHRLDEALAHGVSPETTVALTLRAQALMTMAMRRQVATGASRVLTMASREPRTGRPPVPVCRERVRCCSAEFGALIDALLAASPVGARGVAMARVLLCDASGPVYHRACTDDLGARLRSAVVALRPE